ncbi:hypothetical protein Hdeb2414_s0006g00189831 [Helianthus debilis subsp. tardiflorus]
MVQLATWWCLFRVGSRQPPVTPLKFDLKEGSVDTVITNEPDTVGEAEGADLLLFFGSSENVLPFHTRSCICFFLCRCRQQKQEQ